MSSQNLTLAFTLLLASLPSLTHAAPVVTLEAQALVVSGLPPGGEVVYFSVSREPFGYVSAVVRREGQERDVDLDGAIRIELEQPITQRSIWVVAELSTGVLSTVTPEGYPLVTSPGGGLALSVEGAFTRLGANAMRSHVLVVRPTVGAWVATLTDGSTADEDGGGNRTIVTGLAELQAVATGPPPPSELSPGDRIVEIDSDAMTYAFEIVGGAQ
jgi:hypothetical protein